MNYKILAILMASTMTVQLFSQQANATRKNAAVHVTAAQSVARAMANQPLIQAAQAAVQSARAKLGQARSSYFPNVGGTATWNHIIPNEQFQFGDEMFTMQPTDYWNFNVGANQLIYDFGKREFEVKLAESGIDAALIDVRQIATNIAFETRKTFYSVLYLSEEVDSLDGRVANLEQHRAEAQKREATGSSTKLDVLSTEVSVAAAKTDRIDAADQLERQKTRLRQLMGLTPDDTVVVEGDFVPGSIVGDQASLIEGALANRTDFLRAMKAEEMSRLNETLASLGNRPSITACAGLGFKNGLFTIDTPDLNKLQFDWQVGIGLDVPIFDGFLTANKTAEAAGKLAASKAETENLRRAIIAQVVQAIRSLDASRSRVGNSMSQLAQANDALSIAKDQYDLGVATNLQYLDAQNSLEVAKLNHLNALYKEALSEIELDEAVGKITSDVQIPR
jgi:outer membrane protein TolC